MKILTPLILVLLSASVLIAQQKKSPLPSRVDSIFSNYNNKTGPGAAVGIVQNGKVIFSKGYGLANMEYDIPITPQSIFDIASVSKQFAGFAISTLVQEGKISLQDDIHKYVPEVPNFGKTITIEHLVHHTSGLRDWPEGLNVAGWRWDEVFSFEDIIRMVKHQKELDFEPGSKYSYSNTGYNLLALTVEKVTGVSFRSWTDKNIFKPLHMDHSFFQDDDSELTKNMAYSYYRSDNNIIKKSMTGLTALGSSSLFTTVDDLCKWVINFDQQITAKNPVYVKMLEDGKLNNGDKVGYAFGLGVNSNNGPFTVSHTGGWAGYRTVVMNFPEEKLSIIVLSNVAEFNPSGTALQIARIFIKDKLKTPAGSNDKAKDLPTIKLNASLLEKYSGTYKLGDGWFVTLSPEDGQLSTQANSESKFPTLAKSDSVIWVEAYGASMTFVTSKDGKVNLLRYKGINAPRITPMKPDPAKWKDITGTYYSEEFQTEYRIDIVDGKLAMHHMRLGDLEIKADMESDEKFMSDIGSMVFFNENGKSGFRLSRGRIKNVRFDKR